MAAHLKFPCIANIFNRLLIIRANNCVSSTQWHSVMADSQNWDSMRAQGKKLKKKFDDNRDKRPDRKLDLMKRKYGDKLGMTELTFKVVSTGCYDSVKSVLLHTGHKSYMFNCGDGIARKCSENGGKWSKLEDIFITHNSWKNVPGTFEMAASLKSIMEKGSRLRLIGLGQVNSFCYNENMTFHGEIKGFVELVPAVETGIEDQNMTVYPVVLCDQRKPGDENSAACAYKLDFKLPKRKVDSSKLVKHCVKPGPWLRDLIDKGIPQTFGDKTIHPDDVLFPQPNQETVLVLECPTLHHLPSLVSQSENLSRKPNQTQYVDVVIHMSCDEVMQHKDYQKWMSEFPPSTKHLILSEKKELLTLSYAWQQQEHLSKIEQSMFPHLRPLQNDATKHLKEQNWEENNVIYCLPNSSYSLRPEQKFSVNECIEPTAEAADDYFEDVALVQGTVMSRVTRTNLSDSREYPVISMLGTASAQCTRTRNTTGILMQLSADTYILLDCGPGTYSQILHLYGPEKTQEILRKLKFVFLSHGHADHHMGIMPLMAARREMYINDPVPPLYISYTRKLGVWLNHQNMQFNHCFENSRGLFNGLLAFTEDLSEGVLRDNLKTRVPRFDPVPPFFVSEYNSLLTELGLKSLSTFLVEHAYSRACFGITVEHKDWKIVFSGDTMPCESVIKAAQGADLLIHEGTMGDSLVEDAKLKTHSTVSQAIDVGKKSNAKFTLLTHFSNRYPKFPDRTQQLMESNNVGIAFDNVVFRLRDLPNLTMDSLWDCLSAMYPRYADSNAVRQEQIKGLKEEGVKPAEIVKIMNKRALDNEVYISKRRALAKPELTANSDKTEQDGTKVATGAVS